MFALVFLSPDLVYATLYINLNDSIMLISFSIVVFYMILFGTGYLTHLVFYFSNRCDEYANSMYVTYIVQ